FTVEAGEVLGLLGPNGAGKTTTVETLEGYRATDAGTVAVLGLDPIRDHKQLTPRIGVMLQEGGLYPGIRPMEALRLFAAYYDDHEDPDGMLDLVGLRPAAGTLVRRLSGGQKQRLSLALALIGKPEVVFLDEPTAGMDPHARLTTWEVVVGLKERGSTVILTTHAVALGDLRAGRRTLEEVFLQVTAEPSTAGGEDDEANVPGGRRRSRARSRSRS